MHRLVDISTHRRTPRYRHMSAIGSNVRAMSLAPIGLIDSCKMLMADKHEKAEIMNESEIQDITRRPMLASSFDGHICSIPSKKRLTKDDRWICIECDQRWKVGSHWDRIKWEWVLHWKMYGRNIFNVV